MDLLARGHIGGPDVNRDQELLQVVGHDARSRGCHHLPLQASETKHAHRVETARPHRSRIDSKSPPHRPRADRQTPTRPRGVPELTPHGPQCTDPGATCKDTNDVMTRVFGPARCARVATRFVSWRCEAAQCTLWACHLARAPQRALLPKPFVGRARSGGEKSAQLSFQDSGSVRGRSSQCLRVGLIAMPPGFRRSRGRGCGTDVAQGRETMEGMEYMGVRLAEIWNKTGDFVVVF